MGETADEAWAAGPNVQYDTSECTMACSTGYNLTNLVGRETFTFNQPVRINQTTWQLMSADFVEWIKSPYYWDPTFTPTESVDGMRYQCGIYNDTTYDFLTRLPTGNAEPNLRFRPKYPGAQFAVCKALSC